MKSFAFALKTNRVVSLLDLRNNKLGDSGVRELCYALNQQYSAYEVAKKEKLAAAGVNVRTTSNDSDKSDGSSKNSDDEDNDEKDKERESQNNDNNNKNSDEQKNDNSESSLTTDNQGDKKLLEDSDQIDKVSLATSVNSTQDQSSLETGIQTLVLWNNQITGSSMNAISQVIRKYKWLVTLNLGQNPKIGDDGVFALRPGLQRAKLQRLGMFNCGLECEAAVAIAEVIAEARYLIRIDLRKNDIRFSGIMALAHAMKENTKLLFLNIDSGKFSIKKNYNKRSQSGEDQKSNKRSQSSDSDEDTKEMQGKNNNNKNNNNEENQEDDETERELAEHQLKFAKLIDEYQKRNQEILKTSQEE